MPFGEAEATPPPKAGEPPPEIEEDRSSPARRDPSELQLAILAAYSSDHVLSARRGWISGFRDDELAEIYQIAVAISPGKPISRPAARWRRRTMGQFRLHVGELEELNSCILDKMDAEDARMWASLLDGLRVLINDADQSQAQQRLKEIFDYMVY